MLIPLIVVVVGILMIWAETRSPGRHWPRVKGWWGRALLFNGFQAGAVFGAGYLWDGWMRDHQLWSADALGPVWGALVGYFVLTFVYYWWHRFRHEIPFLWRWFHQLHHSPQRLEIITSFYKHPFEILANAAISSAVMYLVVGLSAEAAAGATLLAGLAELFYHWNVKTPHWLGYFTQRPESHCVHHEEGVHHKNYGDFPFWDMLFGTFYNPPTFDGRCGFADDGEFQIADMLRGKDIESGQEPRYTGRLVLLAVVGFLGIFGNIIGNDLTKGVAAFTAASPAPKVFTSHDGFETFSTQFELQWELDGEPGSMSSLSMTPDNYAGLKGPYNRRNVYGAALAYGPVLMSIEKTRPMFLEVSRHAMCAERGAVVLRELGIDPNVENLRIVFTPIVGTPDRFLRQIDIDCSPKPGGEQ